MYIKVKKYFSWNTSKRVPEIKNKIHAPGMLVRMLKQKLECYNAFLKEISPAQLKASQYNHYLDEYTKKSLSNRWNDINGDKIQRDCYSSFLIYNTDEIIIKNTKEVINKKTNTKEIKETIEYKYNINSLNCNQNYKTFKNNHDKQMLKIKEAVLNGKKFPTCMGTKYLDKYLKCS